MVARAPQQTTHARFTPFLRGAIYGLLLAGWTYSEIAEEVEKPDGTNPSQQAVSQVAAQLQAHGGFSWNGVSASGEVGRPKITTDALDKKIVALVFKHRGRAMVTIKFVQKMCKAARKLSSRTVGRRLGEAGLAWLRRRRKTLVPAAHKVSRLDFAGWVLTRTAATLTRWAFSDGTSFYLGRDASEQQQKARGTLGPFVWRRTDGRDGMFEDCVGPSSYWKAQGLPVKIWGLLVAGMLFVWVLPAKKNMNAELYAWVVTHKFVPWLKKAHSRKFRRGAFLVQDHERCLWKPEPREAMRSGNISLLENFPKCSQDLNPIEIAWRELKARLYVTAPEAMESREAFICRMRQGVAWVNVNRAAYFKKLCSCQKEWAVDVQKALGARTVH